MAASAICPDVGHVCGQDGVVREPAAGATGVATAKRPSSSTPLWWFFGLDCLLATTVRLALAWWTGGYATDVLTFQSWADTLRAQPLGHFYSSAQSPDHLPGDLWILKATEWVFITFGGHDVYGRVFALLTQVVPTLGDLLTALMLLLIVRQLSGAELAGRCARWYLLNPATIILTGVWGQWDSVSLGLLLTGVWLLLQDRAWVVSSPFLVWAVLVKPQLAVPVVCFLVLLGHRLISRYRDHRARALDPPAVPRLLAWVALGVTTAYAILIPFNVHPLRAPAGGFTLVDRIHAALGLYPYTSLGAANLWMIPVGSLDRVRDDTAGWLGLTAQQWGMGLLVLALLFVTVTWSARLRHVAPVTSACWAATASTFAGFILSTRVHERYALPILGLGLILLALHAEDRRLTTGFWLVSSCLTLNMVLVLYGGLRGPAGQTMHFGSAWWTALAVLYCSLAVGLLAWPWSARTQLFLGSRSRT
jgi:dolichyl-phosphate-mannose-protein mannosyltransferase